jgi:hypothetical protein
LSLIFISCGTKEPIKQPKPESTYFPEVWEFGNGVYYFNFNERSDALPVVSGHAFAKFLRENPNLEIVTVFTGDTAMHGMIYGYVVITKPKTCK